MTAPPSCRFVEEPDLPLSSMQQAMLADRDGASARYNVPLAFRIEGPLDAERLGAALEALVARHEPLRTRFHDGPEGPVQAIAPALPGLLRRVSITDADADADADADGADAADGAATADADALARVCRAEAGRPFDLTRDPPVRATLVQAGAQVHALVLNFDHIAVDGWSVRLILAELARLYADPAAALPEPELQYADWAAWQQERLQSGRLEAARRQVAARFDGVDGSLGWPVPPVRPGSEMHGFTLAPDRVAAVAALARRAGTTSTAVLAGCFALLLGRLAGQRTVLFGMPTAQRDRQELHGTVGCFVNTVPVRAELAGADSAGGLLQRLGRAIVAALDSAEVPYDQAVRDLPAARAGQPALRCLFNFDDAEVAPPSFPGCTTAVIDCDRGTGKFDLMLSMLRSGGAIRAGFDVSTALLDAATRARLPELYGALLDALAAAPDARPGDLGLLPAARAAEVCALGRGASARPATDTLHARILAAAAAAPAAAAVNAPDGTLDFAALAQDAGALRDLLRAQGAGRGARVAVLLPRGLALPTAMLASMAADAAYLPLDPDQPDARLAETLADAAPAAAICPAAEAGRIAGLLPAGTALIACDGRTCRLERAGAATRRPGAAGPADPAYVIYTSGSTGRPKGVVLPHRAVLAYLDWAVRAFRAGAGDGAPVVTATAFDATVLSFWAPLLAGRPIELLPEADPVPALAERLAARGRTGDPFAFVKLTPAHLDLLAELGPVAAQAAGTGGFVVGGEALAADTARPWLQAGTRVFNEYGPTETAVGCCVADLAAGQLPAGGSVPIGRPIDGAALYVLDPALNPLPPGIEGELFIGGAGVAHGYWRRPGLTAERFLPDPFAPTPGARMYRTGDRAVLQADGVLQFRGRADAQVKLHGVRIEPGEIEAELRAIAGVQAAAVALAGSGPEARLVAYVVGSVQPARLDARLAERLPAHMRPERTILLEALPLTPNGKLDRRALAARPLPAAAARPAPAEPGAPAAAADPELLTGLTRLWSTLLQREAGPDSDFFDLGGSSLTAIRLLARIKRAHGVALTFPDLRAHPTPAALAAHLAAHPSAHPTATEVPADPPQLAQVLDQFRQVLKQDALAPDEDFFAAGGTSLKAIQALARLRRSLEPALPANALHQGRSARGVARLAAELGAGSAQAAAEAEAAPAPAAPTVSPGERQLWLDSQIGAAGSRFVMQAAFALDRPLEPEVLDRAIAELGHRHPVLRTAYVAEGEGVAPRLLAAPAAEPTLRTVASGELASAVAELARLDARAGFDLAAGRTWRVAAACAPGTTGVVLTLHHIVSDATSLGNVLRELTALLSGQALPAAPAADYRSYAGARVRAAEAAERRDLPYWRDTLAQPPGPLELPADRPRRPGHQPLGSAVPVEIEPALAARLAALAGARRIGLQAVLMAGYAALLHRLGGQDDLVVGVPVSERPDGHEDTVGLYLNTLPLRLRLDPGLTGAGLLDAVGQGMGALLGHRDLPFSRIVEALAPARTEGRTPLLHTVLDWRDAADEPARFTGAARPLALDVATAPFDLAVSLRREREGRILGGFIFDRAQFDAETVAAWSRSFVRLLEALAERPDCEVVRLPAVAPADLPRAWIEGPPARSVPELSDLLKGALAQHADRIALETPDGALTYAALGQRIAAARGGASGPAVIDGADPLDRVVQALAAVFDRRAIALIDPDLPAARRAAMRELLAARAGRLAERGEAAAYIQFTSGSTGTPKAAALGRAALANLAAGIAAELAIAPGARVLQLAAPAFDAWIWELFTTLAGGGTLVLESRAALQPGAPLARTLTAHRISHATMTPSAIAALGEAELPDLRVLVSAGEPLGADLAERWAAGRRLVNAYGPCEATVCTSLDDCRPGAGAPTIGRPIAGLAALVVDRFGAPAIPGAAGELWIAGTGVGLGYLGQPELTDARFVADPRPDRDGRVYRSGDVVRVRGDGRLQFVGRDDRQVKVHGVRIELDEVEHALASLPGVVHAAVRTVAGVDGRPALAAWVSGTDTLTADAVRAGLARALPQAMLPAWLGVVAQMPLTATGKVDRSALPDPTAVAPESGDDAPAADPGEAAVAEIMAELLRRPAPLGRWRNFFTLGGHSLLAVRLAARLGERLGRPVPLPLVFQHPTPAGLAAALAADGEGAPAARLRALRPADAQHDGAGPPAILVHSVDGSAAAYAALAAAWPPGRTVLALEQGRGFDDLDRMAEAYAEALLAGPARGEGPVLLAGWSLGAPVAAALAGRLRARGRRVGLVLIDAAAPGAGPDPGPDTGTDAAALAEAARAAGGDAALAERVRRNVALVAGHGFAQLPGEAAVIRAEATARPGLGDDLGWGRVFQRVHAERQPGTHHEILTTAPGELAHTIERLWLGMGTEERDDVA